ncbi:hypothetical protein EDD37DRAFT_482716 [Exophiala viscosa]|uniref:uncharacterized protein n=1 Tax=Exophiala viscosa TaxID=2486360 RepID=UPI0021999A77|nr:hypothetical protein EDD37DRAFT_482716 [Exophiala viscosa]
MPVYCLSWHGSWETPRGVPTMLSSKVHTAIWGSHQSNRINHYRKQEENTKVQRRVLSGTAGRRHHRKLWVVYGGEFVILRIYYGSDKTLSSDIDQEIRLRFSTSKFAGLFHRVICDEGHKLKNCRTRNATAIDKLYAPKKWIVTATPMINSVADLLGYLYLFWNPAWKLLMDRLDGWEIPTTAEELYKEETLVTFREKCPNYQAKFGEVPLFMFDPQPYAALINSGKMSVAKTASRVLHALLSRLQLRWTMASKIQLGNDLTYQPGINVIFQSPILCLPSWSYGHQMKPWLPEL